MEDYFIKCSLCLKTLNNKRKIITLNCGHNYCSICLSELQYSQICVYCNKKIREFSYKNDYLIDLYNSNYFLNTLSGTKEKVYSYCIDCGEIIESEKLHLELFIDHKLVTFEELKEKIDKFKESFDVILKRNDLANKYIITLKEKLRKDEIKSSLLKSFKEIILSNMYDNLQEIKKQNNFNKIKDIMINSQDKLISNKNKNLSVYKEFNKSLYLSYKYIHKTIKKEENKILVTYIKNTKKIVLYNLEENTHDIIEIDNLPFKFFKLSHSIDYHSQLGSIIISGGKQDSLIYSDASKVSWEYNIKRKTLNRLFEIPEGLANHRAIILNNFYFIIGGNNYRDQFFNNVYKLNLLSFNYNNIKEICKLNIPRSSFGISVINDDLIYVFFGITTNYKLVNSIEIVPTNNVSKFAKLIELNNEHLRLKDVGVMYNKIEQNFIIIGGKDINNIQNQKYYIYEKEKNIIKEKENNKFIGDSHFLSLGLQFGDLCAILSNDRYTGEDPSVFKYNTKEEQWTCVEINIK